MVLVASQPVWCDKISNYVCARFSMKDFGKECVACCRLNSHQCPSLILCRIVHFLQFSIICTILFPSLSYICLSVNSNIMKSADSKQKKQFKELSEEELKQVN